MQIEEYGKRLEHLGQLLQDQNTRLRDLIAAADACAMGISFSVLPTQEETDDQTSTTR